MMNWSLGWTWKTPIPGSCIIPDMYHQTRVRYMHLAIIHLIGGPSSTTQGRIQHSIIHTEKCSLHMYLWTRTVKLYYPSFSKSRVWQDLKALFTDSFKCNCVDKYHIRVCLSVQVWIDLQGQGPSNSTEYVLSHWYIFSVNFVKMGWCIRIIWWTSCI